MAPRLWTYSEIARQLGVDRRTVSELAKVLGFPERDHPHAPNGRGLTQSEVGQLRKMLRRPGKGKRFTGYAVSP